jgi:pyruvate/2-oxoacid:ferredoxin oxidoreductase beta subunit
MFDIGFQALSRLLASGINVKVFVLDTQVYSNTGGQASTSSYTGQNTKMSGHGKTIAGKQERRKEIAQIAMMHPRTFVAQTTCAHINHFYRAVIDALEFDGPAIVCCYTTCQPEHGVGDNMATDQARLAVDTRAFPLLVYDPRKGGTIRERLSLQGNPAVKDDWWVNPKTGKVVDFIDFARSEGRFEKHFDKNGNPSETLLAARQDRVENWRVLQELAGMLPSQKSAGVAEKPAAKVLDVAALPTKSGGSSAVDVIRAAAAAKTNGHNAGLPGDYAVGVRIRYKDTGDWVTGTLKSLEPAVLVFDDQTQIRTTQEVLRDAIAEGLIVRE